MSCGARIHSTTGEHHVKVSAGDRTLKLAIPSKPSGLGSGVSGGEFLTLTLATCYCNNIYREAAKMGIEVSRLDVECGADFPTKGEPARNVTFTARITAKASEAQVRELAAQSDRLAEIQNTIRSDHPSYPYPRRGRDDLRR